MNAEECARLVSIVRGLYPAQRFDDDPRHVVNMWGLVVRDVAFAEAETAVVRIARRGATWCSPGDVRGEVARLRNVLAPDVDQLLADVRDVASHDGIGRRLLHPAAQRAYDSIGGAQAIKRLDARGLLSLRRTIEQAVQRDDEITLTRDLPPPRAAALPIREQIEQLERAELARQLPPPPSDAHPETADELRQMRDEFGKVE